MVTTKTGDMFTSNAQTLVNTVNCVGVMGKGVALAFKERFPEMYKDYVRLCAAKKVHLGEPYLYKSFTGPWVLNFPTKDHWRSVSRLSDIVAGLEYLEKHYEAWGITSLSVPPLGCGQGGLEWRIVGPTLFRHLNRLNIPVDLYAPTGTPKIELTPEFLGETATSSIPVTAIAHASAPMRIQPELLVLVEILRRVVTEPYHFPVGRTTFQKIAYFATEAGLTTGLKFTKGSYGPFSSDLKPALTKLVNNGLIEERSMGNMFAVYPGSTFEDTRKAFENTIQNYDDLIEHVADLFMRMRTDQAEIAASVFFVARNLAMQKEVLTELEVFQGVLDWKIKRKPPLKPEAVAKTVRSLNLLRWVTLEPSDDIMPNALAF